MNRIITRTKLTIVYAAALVLVTGQPMVALADDEAPASPSSSTTAPVTDPAPATPPASSTASPAPATATSAPAPQKPDHTYTFDSATGKWNTEQWVFDAASGTYKPRPAPAPVPAATPAAAAAPAASSTKADTSSAAALDSQTTSQISNALDSLATTGTASVNHNTLGGNATSGDASAVATIINNVNSSMSNADNQKAASFVTDVVGDVNGDIMLQPLLLKAMLEAKADQSTTSTLNSTTNTGITNDVTLKAMSGNADVTGNTRAGNATSGSANTVANVMNIVNSMISANQSFVGTINIYGNLNGDILIAPDFIAQLLASNGGAPAATTEKNKLTQTVNTTDTQSIVNNVALAANSGAAAVVGNTAGGNATTGDASTNVVIFNLSGHEIVAANSLLVFVNVLGKWVGVIVDAPTGATAAAIGNGVTTDTTRTADLTVTTDNSTVLTNNLTLASESGNAQVAGNTLGGNATSGNATASANIANVTNSQLGLSGWFGVLFINVFGTWNGSFGVDTAAGGNLFAGKPVAEKTVVTDRQVIRFIPRKTPMTTTFAVPTTVVGASASDAVATGDEAAAVLAASTTSDQGAQHLIPAPLPAHRALNVPLLAGALVLVGLCGGGLKYLLFGNKR